MQLKTHRHAGTLCVTVSEPRIDARGAVQFKDQFRAILDGHDGRCILDMSNVIFLDSSGLGALVAVMKMLSNGENLELAGCAEIVLKVLRLTKMDKVFILHDTLQSADAGPRSAA